ncbi:MAG: ribose-phosphate pyrophosphokinase [Candidatus Aminicenantes bacterium]|nr:ribose-phosphate pyrophosphokinase [Candidatus Aminicenantes bacterium]MDH5466489.1 ribose-phosphate pyrophosphokinase [Candidatus Aminicenantes bacterium]MDH5704380.1 ribose-phosphate pyrophosphokinase [Candidatus Aminicenantes bacterium]
MDKENTMKIFAGSSNLNLAQEVAEFLKVELGKCVLERFSDGEIHFYIDENVRGEDVFVIQSGANEANFHMMELFLMLDAFKRASAERITAVIPYYCYARQDWKDRPRVPISARLMADLLEAAGAMRILTMDLHSPQIQGFFSIPVDNLRAAPVLANTIQNLELENLTIVSPDAGGVGRARVFAKRMSAELAIIDKRRPAPNVAKVIHVIGDVENRDVVILDDMVDTGGTLVNTVEALKREGAGKVYSACTHAVLSGQAVEKIDNSEMEKLIVTNTIPLNEKASSCQKIVSLSVAPLFGEAIRRINKGYSVSSLFV